MQLISLHLQNFRQHQQTDLQFEPGLTAIIGPNGSGKTSLLEAIAWALYGARAIRGKVEDLRYAGATGRAPVEAVLEFRLGSHMYRILRRTDTAELRLDGGSAAYAGTTAVNDAVRKLLGMDLRMFYASFFTGQKELAFMANLEGPARAIAIGRMLGYDRLTKVRDRANRQKLDLKAQAEGLERGLPDGDMLRQRKQQAQADLRAATQASRTQAAAVEAARRAHADLAPQAEESRERAARHEALVRAAERARHDLGWHQARLQQLDAELERLDQSAQELSGLQEQVAGLADLELEFRELNRLRPYETRRVSLSRDITCLEDELEQARQRLDELDAPEKELDTLRRQIRTCLDQMEELDRRIQFQRDDWVGRREAGKAQWSAVMERRKELLEHRQTIEQAGREGKCPTCERPLQNELPVVLKGFDEQIRELDVRRAELKALASSLRQEPAELLKLQDERRALEAEVAPLRDSATRLECDVQERVALVRACEAKQQQLDRKRRELAQLPVGFDEARFTRLQEELGSLRPLAGQVRTLCDLLKRLPLARQERAAEETSIREQQEALRQSEEERKQLAFDESTHLELLRRLDQAERAVNEATLAAVQAEAALTAAQTAYDAAVADEKAYKEKAAELTRLRKEHRYAETLASRFEALRTLLNSRIRPELEQAASDMLSNLTEGRYTQLRVDEQYGYTLLDDNEPKPVISGGEEDVVSLALRLAISEMIADRAGQPLSLLVLDEIFGSLDVGRRENVMGLLNNLRERFEQIILISHIESIHDAVDQALWVAFDPREKVSRVLEANPTEELTLE